MARRYYTIPVNYDDGKLKILGYFSVKSLIESIILTIPIGGLVYFISSLFQQKLLGAILFVFVFLSILIINSFVLKNTSLLELTRKFIGFSKQKKILKFRRIQKHIKSETKIKVDQEEQSWFEKKFKINEKLKENESTEKTEDFSKELMGDIIGKLTPLNSTGKKMRYTQEVVPVKKIKNGVVITKEGNYIAVMEFLPNNFSNKDPDLQAAIINTFASFNKTSLVQVQWKVQTLKTDAKEFLNNVDERLKNEKDKRILNFAEVLKRMVLSKSYSSNIDHKYYLIFSYEPKGGILNKESEKDAIDFLNQYVINAIEVMRRCQNEYVAYRVPENFLYEFYYKFYNRFSASKESVVSRIRRVYGDVRKAKGLKPGDDNPIVKPHNVIAPRGIDLSKRNYMTMDGLYYTYFVISDFPTEVEGGWPSLFTSFGPNYDFDFFLHREDRAKMLESVGRKISAKEGDITVMPEQSAAAQELKKAYAWDTEIQQALSNGADFFYLMIIVTVYDRDFKTMIKRRDQLRNYMKEKGFETETPNFNVEQFFNTSMPVCNPDKELFKTYRRNVLTDGAAAIYPLTTSSMNDSTGIPIGTEITSNATLIYDPFNTKKRASANGFILGLTGSGKTYLTMLFALRLRILQTQVFVIAPTKGFEYQSMCDAVGGIRISVGPAYNNCINIMQITPVNAEDAILMKDDVTFDPNKSLVTDKVESQLMPFFKIIIPGMEKVQREQFNSLLLNIYKDYGMDEKDNNSIYINNDPSKPLKPMPTIQDVYERLLKHPRAEMRKLADYFVAYVDGTLKCFNGQTNVDMGNKLMVFDLDPLRGSDETFKVGIYIVQNYVWRVVKMGRSHRKKAIFYDEAWQMMKYESARSIMQEVYKTIRGFRGFAITTTQNIEDLMQYEEGRSIVDCSTFQALFHANPEQARNLRDTLRLSEQHFLQLTQAQRGEALIRIDGEPFSVIVEATPEEDRLFQTDGSKLEQLNKMKKGG